MTKTQSHFVFEYLYRDAANFKAWGELLLIGNWTDHDTARLTRSLDGGEYFVAEQVGIPTLYDQLYEFSEGATEDDHAFHEFSRVRAATADDLKSMTLWGSTQKILDAFVATRGRWNLGLSPHGDGLSS